MGKIFFGAARNMLWQYDHACIYSWKHAHTQTHAHRLLLASPSDSCLWQYEQRTRPSLLWPPSLSALPCDLYHTLDTLAKLSALCVHVCVCSCLCVCLHIKLWRKQPILVKPTQGLKLHVKSILTWCILLKNNPITLVDVLQQKINVSIKQQCRWAECSIDETATW